MDKLKTILKGHQQSFAPIVDFDPSRDKLLLLNFSSSNTGLKDYYISDTNWFILYLQQTLLSAGARYGIGGYGEDRILYKRYEKFGRQKNAASPVHGGRKEIAGIDAVLESATDEDEPRSIHLGTDIWGPAGTKVYAPLGGMVHSFAYNNEPGDYGATIILQHQLDMVSFYSLYGHVSLADIAHLRKGMFITRGECFAHFGNEKENGGWPPHLHFQVIEDIRFAEGDYPGVCGPSEKEKYLANCPDGDLMLNMARWL